MEHSKAAEDTTVVLAAVPAEAMDAVFLCAGLPPLLEKSGADSFLLVEARGDDMLSLLLIFFHRGTTRSSIHATGVQQQ